MYQNISNSTNDDVHIAKDSRHLSVVSQIVITVFYVIGAVGNLAALIYLSTRRKRNRKHTFMLRCLASNDLIALVGMLVQMNIELYAPDDVPRRFLCALRVVWRAFGLTSGCIAVVMAIERFLALTRPFLYQKHVTYCIIRRGTFVLWLWAALLTCLPFVGFGVYYDTDEQKCVRYRDATEPFHVAYKFLFFSNGVLLWFCMVWCNLAVIRVLCRMGSGNRKVLVRRISRSSNHGKNVSTGGCQTLDTNTATAEEIAFAKLMAWLCVSFLLGWMPQMISIPLAHWIPDARVSKGFFRVADVLMAIHYTLDPYIYVIFRGSRRPCFPNFFKSLFRVCSKEKICTKTNSLQLSSGENEEIRLQEPAGNGDSEQCSGGIESISVVMPLTAREGSHVAAAAV